MSPREPRKQVYVSSTFSDLEQHRAYLKLALEKAGYDVECMERYPAFDTRPADKCLADVAACDVYVVLVALRYGHIPAEDNPACKSITEMEYDKAVETTRPKLAFMLDIDDEDFGWPPKRCDNNWQDADSNIARFRERVGNELGRALFTNPESLATAVLQALRQQEITAMPAGERDRTQIREAYLDWLRRECDCVELLGLDLKESRNVGLGHVYVPAVTNQNVKSDHKDVNFKKPPFLLLDNLGRSPLYVPGVAGSGKSTFCRWLALVVAEGQVPAHRRIASHYEGLVETLPGSLVGRMPVLLLLRQFPRVALTGNGYWTRSQFESRLVQWIDYARPGGLTGAVFRDELEAGHCLLILDGVDEVPERYGDDLPRYNLLTGLADALPEWRKAGNCLIVTSRPYGLSAEDQRRLGLPTAELAELPYELQRLFVRRWFDAVDPLCAEEKADGLLREMNERQHIGDLCRNPMLLTALCIKYDEGRRLPQDFYALYDVVVRQVLYKRFATENERDLARNRLSAIALGMHRGVTEPWQWTPEVEVAVDEVDRILASLGKLDWASESGAVEAGAKRELLLSDSGLLLPRNNRRAAFYHQSFQEFLAAERLQKLRESPEIILASHAGTPAWRGTLRFLFCAIAERDKPERALTAWHSLISSLEPSALDANPAPALVLADCLEVAHAKGWCMNEFVIPLRNASEHALYNLSPELRAQLWLTLGRLGLDDRLGVGLRPDGLPDIAWESCEAGEFVFGDPPRLHTIETVFRIARYPVTHRQFQAFIDADGYSQEEWWSGLRHRPDEIPGRWSDPNAPRETVSWHEAMAFCRWLDFRLKETGELGSGWRVCLPTEEQWERAARGADGRRYPWDGEFMGGFANINETLWNQRGLHLQRTSPVGIYPDGIAPSGALDMAGNVWEWCRNQNSDPDSVAHEGYDQRVLRGGSWSAGSDDCRAAFRRWASSDSRLVNLGFRVCCVSDIDLHSTDCA